MNNVQTTDGDLLAEFIRTKDPAPFAELVRRHRGLVMSACRRATHHEQDAEDAAQRVFWALARKARSLSGRTSLAGWLFQAAQNEARDIRRSNQRRQVRETAVVKQDGHEDPGPQQFEWREALDGQLSQMPTKYREPLVLHHLQGLPHKQAAEQMGVPESTFAMRLSRARELLRDRMVRSGLAFSASSWALLTHDQSLADENVSSLSTPGFYQQAISEMEKSSMMFSRGRAGAVLGFFLLGVAGTALALSQPQIKEKRKPIKPVQAKEVDQQQKENKQYATELFRQLQQENNGKNLVLSPYSISGAFGMVYAGSAGNTQKEIARTLHFATDPQRLPWVFQKTTRDLMARAQKNKMQLNIANALVLTGSDVKESYKNTILNRFEGEIASGSNPLEVINQWVSEKTNGNVKKILSKLSRGSVCVLANAIYFKSVWKNAFDPKQTRQALFILDSGKTVKVPMMSQSSDFSVLVQDQFQMIDLPYQGDDLSMVILLPNFSQSLDSLKDKLSDEALSALLKKLDKQPMREFSLGLPKFKVQSTLDLIKTCQTMGLTNSFSPTKANFAGMAGQPHEVWIHQVVHKAVVEVEEKGTVASAATTIEMQTPTGVKRTLVFTVNRPFVFLIRDKKTNTLLFMGQMTNPTEKA